MGCGPRYLWVTKSHLGLTFWYFVIRWLCSYNLLSKGMVWPEDFLPIFSRMYHLPSHTCFSVAHRPGTIWSRIQALEQKSKSFHTICLIVIQRTFMIEDKGSSRHVALRFGIIKMEWNRKWRKWKKWWMFTSLKVFSSQGMWVAVELSALPSTGLQYTTFWATFYYFYFFHH